MFVLEQASKSTATHKAAWVYYCTIKYYYYLCMAHQEQLVPQYIYEPYHAKRVLRVILIKMFIFYFLNVHYFKINLWNFEGNSCRNKFLWDSKHSVFVAASFLAIVTSWYLRKDMRKFTSVISYMNIICIAQWLFEANLEILHCSGAFAWRHKHCKRECSFMKTHVDNFYHENMTSILNYITATLRTLYAWRGSYDKST